VCGWVAGGFTEGKGELQGKEHVFKHCSMRGEQEQLISRAQHWTFLGSDWAAAEVSGGGWLSTGGGGFCGVFCSCLVFSDRFFAG